MKNSTRTFESEGQVSQTAKSTVNNTRSDTMKAQKVINLGMGVSRYGLVALLLIFGIFKFAQFEAEAIEPLVANSPLMSWMYQVMDIRVTSGLIGTIEIILGTMIALRPWSPKLSVIGSLGGVLMFLTSLTFLISTPGMWTVIEGLPVPTDGGFLMKDIIFLGVSLWTAGEALQHVSPSSER